jgi:hypothetical protein
MRLMKKVFRVAGLFGLVPLMVTFPLMAQLAPPTTPAAPPQSTPPARSVITRPPSLSAPTAPTPGVPGDGPRVAFSTTRHDFGKINNTTRVRHEYIVTNVGNALLTISAVQPGCPGCTTALPWDREVQPGKTGKIPVEFNPAGFSGTLSKSVTVTCNDPVQPVHHLSFQATIWQPIDVQPAYVYFMPAEGEATNETKIVRIISNLEEEITLQTPKCDNPALQLELKTVRPGKEFALHVTHAGPTTNAVPQGVITIATSTTNAPLLKVTSVIMPQPVVAVSPMQITIPSASAQSTVGHRQTQIIRNNSSTPMKVTEATVNADGVAVQINESQPGKMFVLTINFPPGFAVTPAKPVVLTIKTTHPRRSTITVPVFQSGAPGQGAAGSFPTRALPTIPR